MRISDWSSDVCSSDLDARFHRGGDAQQIDVVGESDLVADRNVLEQALAVARKHLVRLTRHLSAVETEDRAGIDREPAVVIDLLPRIGDPGNARWTERREAAAANAAAAVEMNSRAPAALKICCCGIGNKQAAEQKNAQVEYSGARQQRGDILHEVGWRDPVGVRHRFRSEEHTSELQ